MNGIRVAYLLAGVLNALWGASLPVTDARLDLGHGRLGVVLLALAVGALAAMPVAGWVAERRPSLLRRAAPAASVALAGPAFAPNFGSLLVSVVVLGMAFGALNVALSVQAVAVERAAGRPIMAVLHGTWTLGAVAGGAAVTVCLRAGLDGSLVMAVGGLCLAPLWPTGTTALGEPTAPSKRSGGPTATAPVRQSEGPATTAPAKRSEGPTATTVHSRHVLALGAIGAAAFATEGAATDWAGVHATRVLGAEPDTASLIFTCFFLAMTVVRFAGDAIRSRWGASATAGVAGVTATAGYALVLLAGALPASAAIPSVMAGWALAGAGMAVVWPIVTSALGAAGAGGRRLSSVTMLSYGGGLAGPALIAFAASHASLPAALLIPAALTVVVAAVAPTVLSAIYRPLRSTP